MQFLKRILKQFFTQWKEPTQRTFCYCPACQNELVSSKSFVSDEDLVIYKCSRCDTESRWLFDAPAPILISISGGIQELDKVTS